MLSNSKKDQEEEVSLKLEEWGEMFKDQWLKEEGQKIALELLVKVTEEASKKP